MFYNMHMFFYSSTWFVYFHHCPYLLPLTSQHAIKVIEGPEQSGSQETLTLTTTRGRHMDLMVGCGGGGLFVFFYLFFNVIFCSVLGACIHKRV